MMYYCLLRVLEFVFDPVIQMALTILVKWTVIGKFKACNSTMEFRQSWNLFQYWLMVSQTYRYSFLVIIHLTHFIHQSKLIRNASWGGLLKLIGSHYEIVSLVYRLLGSKFGKRVYWPGSGVDIIQFDLFEVGDDVVFGSRSVVLTSSNERCAKVVIESGVMVADR